MGHNVTVLRFKKKILNKSINISSRFHSGHFYFRLCWRKKNQQLIVFPGIFSIKFQCFMCKQITFQCCSIGNLVQSTKIKIIQKSLAMVHFHQPRFTIRDVVPSFLSWGFIWIWKRDFKGKTKSRWPSSSAVQSLRSAEKHGTHVLWGSADGKCQNQRLTQITMKTSSLRYFWVHGNVPAVSLL